MNDDDGKWEPITRTDAVFIASWMIAASAPWVGLGIYLVHRWWWL